MRRKRNQNISIEEAKAMAEEAMREQTCDHCDYDPGGASETADELQQRSKHYMHNCSRTQGPRGDPVMLCDDCNEDHNPKQDYIENKRESEKTYVLYECGVARVAEEPDIEKIEGPGGEMIDPPRPDRRERIPIECECGAEIDEVLY